MERLNMQKCEHCGKELKQIQAKIFATYEWDIKVSAYRLIENSTDELLCAECGNTLSGEYEIAP